MFTFLSGAHLCDNLSLLEKVEKFSDNNVTAFVCCHFGFLSSNYYSWKSRKTKGKYQMCFDTRFLKNCVYTSVLLFSNRSNMR